MRKLFLVLFVICGGMIARGQETGRLTYTATAGVGIALNEPASTPFLWQVIGYYNLNKRFSAGVGTGISCYEKTSIPVFADIRFMVINPRQFTPYLSGAAGYAFVPAKRANGGLYVHPSAGVLYDFRNNLKFLLAVGYELQKSERLKDYEDSYFKTEFSEKLKHNSFVVKLGVVF